MKTLGLIGGTSWVSTIDYYRIINQEINKRLGGLNSAKILLYSVNFEDFRPPADPTGWSGIAKQLIEISLKLQDAGAECILLCANTPHIVADDIIQKIKIPLIHIAVETTKVIGKMQLETVGLLGTKFTMEQDFFKRKLSARSISTIIPGDEDREYIHQSIYTEMAKGIFNESTKQEYFRIINKLVEQGAEGIIFGCTEIPMLIETGECPVPVFDTGLIHAIAAVDFALS